MRVAICFSGAFRQFKNCWQNFQSNLLDINKCKFDFFFSSWQNEKIENKKGEISHLKLNTISLSNILNILKPKKYLYLKYSQSIIETGTILSGLSELRKSCDCNKYLCEKCGGRIFLNQIGQLLNIFFVNQLKYDYEKENNIIYDVVIRTRFDLLLLQRINFDLLTEIKNNIIFVPNKIIEHSNFYCDTFAIGSSKSMDFYSKSILSLKSTLSFTKEYVEHILHHNLYLHLNNSEFQCIKHPKIETILYRRFLKKGFN